MCGCNVGASFIWRFSKKKTTICSLYDSQHVQENGSWDFLIAKTANAVVDNNCFSLQN